MTRNGSAAGGGDIDGVQSDDAHIILGILQAVERGEPVTQRAVAVELGVALGLVNAYVKRCMKKGLIKVRSAPPRRFFYYLTPQGFAAKSKLTASYLSHSFSFFRTARANCEAVLAEAVAQHHRRLVLFGASDLAEIMGLCAIDQPVQLVAIVDPAVAGGRFAGLPVVSHISAVDGVDAIIITDLAEPDLTFAAAVSALGEDRVLTPSLLSLRTKRPSRKELLPERRDVR